MSDIPPNTSPSNTAAPADHFSLLKSRFISLMMLSGLLLALIAVTPAQDQESSIATYSEGPAPWDGLAPRLSLSFGQFSVSATYSDDAEKKLAEGQTYTLKDAGFWNACKSGANPPCGFPVNGTITLTRYIPRQHIEGTVKIETIGSQLTNPFSQDATSTPSGFNGPVEFSFSADYKKWSGGCVMCPELP